MEIFEEIQMSESLNTLIQLKLKLKNQVTDPHLNWRERAELYSMVQLINARIQQLER